MRSTATRTDELTIGLAAKQETDTLISSGTDKNRRTCGDSVKKDRRESKGERRQEQARVNPVRLAMVSRNTTSHAPWGQQIPPPFGIRMTNKEGPKWHATLGVRPPRGQLRSTDHN